LLSAGYAYSRSIVEHASTLVLMTPVAISMAIALGAAILAIDGQKANGSVGWP
jgi:hypothetical protein